MAHEWVKEPHSGFSCKRPCIKTYYDSANTDFWLTRVFFAIGVHVKRNLLAAKNFITDPISCTYIYKECFALKHISTEQHFASKYRRCL